MENRVLVFRGGIPAALLDGKNRWHIIVIKMDIMGDW